MIREVEEGMAVKCDFCQRDLRFDGALLVFGTPSLAKTALGILDWFVDGGKHYCPKCVPAKQKKKRGFLPMCDRDSATFSMLILIMAGWGILTLDVGILVGAVFAVVLLRQIHRLKHDREQYFYSLVAALDS